jgi:pyridinium-3,5-biscarboxylic acid mononucleotide sulfurtransferase
MPTPEAVPHPALPAELLTDWQRLCEVLGSLGSAAVAFSGGVDSAVVAAAAYHALGNRMLAVTILSPVEARSDGEAARQTAAAVGFPHRLVPFNDLEDPLFTANPIDRCYHCKRRRMSALLELAQAEGFQYVLDGSNADDLADYRPGKRALAELGVRSPLLEVGLNKEKVRALARGMSLPCAERPSAPCLATRIPYGMPVTVEALQRIGLAESYLQASGFSQVRVRDYGSLARLEVEARLLPALFELRGEVSARLKDLGYHHVALDLDGFRSGSMNASIKE